jgi:hypothetical protein
MFRIKEKLRNGDIAVSGDQWPIFIYHGYHYDPEDPWNGLLRSALLVLVRSSCLCEMHEADSISRLINTSSRLQVPSKRNPKPLDHAMHVSTG